MSTEPRVTKGSTQKRKRRLTHHDDTDSEREYHDAEPDPEFSTKRIRVDEKADSASKRSRDVLEHKVDRPSKRQRVHDDEDADESMDEANERGEEDEAEAAVFGCSDACVPCPQLDFRLHGASQNLPCPLMFRQAPFRFWRVFPEGHFMEVSHIELSGMVTRFITDPLSLESKAYRDMYSFWLPNGETVESRVLSTFWYRAIAAWLLLREAESRVGVDVTEVEQDYAQVEEYVRMLEALHDPFGDFGNDNPDQPNQQLSIVRQLYFQFVRRPWRQRMEALVEWLSPLLNHNVKENWGNDPSELLNRVSAVMRTEHAVVEAQACAVRPSVSSFKRDDPEHARYAALSCLQTLLQSHRAIVVDAEQADAVRFALPVASPSGVDTFTYTEGRPLHIVLRCLKAESHYAEQLALHGIFVVRTLAVSNERSPVPYVDPDFIDRMRYVRWTNGVLCCRTGLFYYERAAVPPALAATWQHYVDNLTHLNKGRIRAMKHFEAPLRYYETMTEMLRGLYCRRHFPAYAEKARVRDEHDIVHMDQTNEVRPPGADEQAAQDAWVQRMWARYDEWVHDPDVLAELDVLDVQLKSVQKVLGDQGLPRAVYRTLMEIFGRALCGIMNDKTRPHSAPQQLLEERLGRRVVDRQEIACALEGTAGTGKSTLLMNCVQDYFTEDIVGIVSDERRPIDPHNTIRHKAVVIAQDMHREKGEKAPLPHGDLKKGISNEAMVNHRLHRDSIIVTLLSQFIFALNDPLPYSDTKGDIARRFLFIPYRKKVSTHQIQFSAQDRRTLREMFVDEERDRYPVVAVFAHLRRLVNVGSRSYYGVPDDSPFAVPLFLRQTQANYSRTQNSIRAFVLDLEMSRSCSTETRYAKWAVERGTILADYKDYCKTQSCPVKDDDDVDQELRRTFGVTLMPGAPLRYQGLKYKDASYDLDAESAADGAGGRGMDVDVDAPVEVDDFDHLEQGD
jgi:hypothetical protein